MRSVALAIISAGLALAQRGGGDWMTGGNDAQRSSWVRTDGKISRASMAKPGFEVVWKLKLGTGLTPPSLLDFYIGYRGFRTLGFFGTANNKVTAVDLDLARIEWEKSYGAAPAGSAGCPAGLTAAVTRPTTFAYPGAGFPRGFGRASGAKSGVGAPHEGAVTLRPSAAPQPPGPPRRPPPPAAGAPAAAPVFNPFAPRINWALALTGDGKLHSMYVSNGEEPAPAVQFLPANAYAQGLIASDNTVYAATANRCGGVPDGVWALDVPSKKVTQWKAAGKLAGSAGPAVGPDGTVFAAAGNELTALAAHTLQPLASHKTGGPEFTSSPVIFEHLGKNLLAASANDGRIHLLNPADLGSGAFDRSEPSASPSYPAGALASWQEESGTRWLLAPSAGAITAWKIVDKGGKPGFEKGWVSRELVSPVTPVVVNGVVFALSTGGTAPAVLYALDGTTGKELWNSGKAIAGPARGGLSAGGSRIFIAGADGTQYAFSFPMEH